METILAASPPKVSNIDFVILKAESLNALYDRNISNIDHSNGLVMGIEKHAFWQFENLQILNLSNNLLGDLEYELFAFNRNLREINFRLNCLQSIPANFTFDSLRFDLSYNSIRELSEQQFFSGRLVDLDLSHNRLQTIAYRAFSCLPELRYLNLADNELIDLRIQTIRLMRLIVANNQLTTVELDAPELVVLCAANNRIGKLADVKLNASTELYELDLSNDVSSGLDRVTVNDFAGLLKAPLSLNILKLNVKDFCDLNFLKSFFQLTYLEIAYSGNFGFFTNSEPFYRMFENLINLKTLILILSQFHNYYLHGIVNLKKLEHLHIECSDPQENMDCFGLEELFEKNMHLTKVFLKSLNRLHLKVNAMQQQPQRQQAILIHELHLLNLGKSKVGDYFNRFPLLVYLNLSGSTLHSLEKSSFTNLVHLRQLFIDDSTLTRIRKQFDWNIQLEVLSFRNNWICHISSYTFKRLKKLTVIDLRGNPLENINYPAVFKDVDFQKTKVYLN